MKQLLLVLAAAITYPMTTLANEVDLRIKGVGFGTPERILLRKLGVPLQNKMGGFNSCADGYEKTLLYAGLTIQLLSDEKKHNFTVFSIRITSPKWLISGVQIGTTVKNIRARFGKPLETRTKNGRESWSYVYKGNDGLAGFHFRKNQLAEMLWEAALC